jgi:hypothetical protein
MAKGGASSEGDKRNGAGMGHAGNSTAPHPHTSPASRAYLITYTIQVHVPRLIPRHSNHFLARVLTTNWKPNPLGCLP